MFTEILCGRVGEGSAMLLADIYHDIYCTMSQTKGWVIWAAAQSRNPRGQWEIWCQLLENFTPDSFRGGELLSGPTPTDIECMGWGRGALDQAEEGTFKGGYLSVPGRETASANVLVPGVQERQGCHRGWSTKSLGGRRQCGWDIVRSHGKEFDFI